MSQYDSPGAMNGTIQSTTSYFRYLTSYQSTYKPLQASSSASKKLTISKLICNNLIPTKKSPAHAHVVRKSYYLYKGTPIP